MSRVGALTLPLPSEGTRCEVKDDGSLRLIDVLAGVQFDAFLRNVTAQLLEGVLTEAPAVITWTREDGSEQRIPSSGQWETDREQAAAYIRGIAAANPNMRAFGFTLACGCGLHVERAA